MDFNSILDKETFIVNVDKHSYSLPVYEVVPEKGIVLTGENLEIKFVRGSKETDSTREKLNGTLHEHLISAMIYDLEQKQEELPSREGALVITKLKEARNEMRNRQIDRIKRAVQGTDKR